VEPEDPIMTVTRDIDAPRGRVWNVLANGLDLFKLGRGKQPNARRE
jgi:uncharacterized protein YndB with AHSA1/START domain